MSARQPSEAYNHGWDDAEIGAPLGQPYFNPGKRRDYENGYRASKLAEKSA